MHARPGRWKILLLMLMAIGVARAHKAQADSEANQDEPIQWKLDAQHISYPADGIQTDFAVSFPHVGQQYVVAALKLSDGGEKPLPVTDYAWADDDTIRFKTPPPKGTSVLLRGTNGIRMTTDTTVLHAFFITGQSLAAGSNKDVKQAAIATRPIYPGFALMAQGGVRPAGHFDDFADLVETGPAGIKGLKETGASGLANHFIRDTEQLFGFKPRVFCAVVALGAQTLAQIGPGSVTNNALLAAVRDCVRVARGHGWHVIVPAIPFCQGESDIAAKTARSSYTRELVAFQRYMQTEIQRITGQAEPVMLIMSQTRSTPNFAPGTEPIIALAQLDADGMPGIRMAAPMYQYWRSDSGHLDIIGENRQGQAWERAILAECYGQGWSPLRPLRWHWASASEIVIQFHTPCPPLVLDTQGDIALTSMTTVKGFEFNDGSNDSPHIVDVALLPEAVDSIRIMLSGPAHGPHPWIGYANRRQSPDLPFDGRLEGARGCLRDSAAHRSLYDQHLSHNWCVMFTLDLPPWRSE